MVCKPFSVICTPHFLRCTLVQSRVHTELERSRHSRLFKNLPSGYVKVHVIKVVNLLELFQLPTLDRQIYLDLSTMFKIVYNMSYFPSDILCVHHAIRTTRGTLGRAPHVHFPIQTCTPPNSNNHSLYVQLKPETPCPNTYYLVYYYLLNYMCGTTLCLILAYGNGHTDNKIMPIIL